MKLTVRELLKMDNLNKARLIAGGNGVDREILSVNVMEVPDIDNWVHAGELLITTMYPLRDQQAKIETLIPRLHQRGLAGIAVKLHRYIEEIPENVIQQADQLGFPIIEIPSDTSFIDLIQPVTSRILELQTNELLRSENIHTQFLDLVLSGGGFTEIASSLSQMLLSPVTIMDRFNKVLGSGCPSRRKHPQDEYIEIDSRDALYLGGRFSPQPSSHQAQGRKVNFMELNNENTLHLLLMCPIKTGEMEYGQIIVWGEPSDGWDSMDLIAIEHASTIAALKMMESRTIHQVEQRFRNDIFEDLLSEDPVVQAKGLQNARQAGLKFLTPFLVIIMGADILLARNLTILEENRVDETLYIARRYIQSFNPQATYWNYGTRMAIYFPMETVDPSIARSRVQACLDRVQAALKMHHGSLPLSAGVSDVFTEVGSFHLAMEQARQSLEIGQAIAEDEQEIVRHYADLGFFRIIDLKTNRDRMERFCKDTLGSLIEYDSQHGTELIDTLRIFLRYNQNATRAARALFIHYNTLRYRLDCITEILGNALENSEQRLALEIALYIYPLVTLNISPSRNPDKES